MTTSSLPRRGLAGIALLLALVLLFALVVPALADYLGPNRTVSTWVWERLQCSCQAVYDEPGPG
jgi:hypothetical protein